MVTDPMTIVKDILSTNWIDINTSNITPEFLLITEKKRIDYGNGSRAKILIHVPRPLIDPAGISVSGKHEDNRYDVDLRVMGADYRTLYLECLEEIKRILQDNQAIPYTSGSKPLITVSTLDYNGQGNDLSNGLHSLYRYMLPVQLKFYNVTR